MLFLIIIGLFFAAIVFFHSLQGFFSAVLSAIFCVVAAAVAVGYHESVVESLLGGAIADYAHALVLLSLFAIVYLVLRTIFDNVVKDNVRVPAAVDKAGAIVMGVVAAVFATGIMAIAASELPFGVSIGGYARFEVQPDRQVVVPTGRNLDRTVYNEMADSTPGGLKPEDAHGVMLLPVDNIVVGAVSMFSEGSLSAGKPLTTIHPDLLTEAFGQRAGIETGGNHVALDLPDKKKDAVDYVGAFTHNFPPAAQKDSEFPKLRIANALKPIPLSSSQTFLIIRVAFKPDAADLKDRIVRFSPGSVRLVVHGRDPATGAVGYQDLFPVGTLQDSTTLYLNKPDDFLFEQLSTDNQGADLVFVVSKKDFETKIPEGTFLEFKRLARIPLGGKEVLQKLPPKDPNFDIMRKPLIVQPPAPPSAEANPEQPAPTPSPEQPSPTPGTPTPTPTPTPAPSNAFQFQNATVSNAVPVTVSAPAGNDGTLVQVPGGTAVVTSGSLKMANMDSTPAEQTQPTKVAKFLVPEGQAMVQVHGLPAASAPWAAVSEPDQYELVDGNGKKYQPFGVFAVFEANGVQRFYLRYVDASTISGASPPDGAGAPKGVTLLYLVPPNTALTEFDDHGQKDHDLSLTVK